MFEPDSINLEQEALIGTGRFGSVYRARSLKFNTYFALKTIPKGELTSDEMFHNEVEMLRHLCHPNIVNLYNFYTTTSSYNILMQYCENSTLKSCVLREGCLNTEKFATIFRQVLEAIKYCHSRNIAHRDLKPENILFDAYGRVQIADWGQGISSENGIVDTYCGTLSYASPECLNKCPFNVFKSDMYSLGVCMYFSVLGKVPWTETVPILKKEQILNNEYLIPPFVDNDIADVIRDLLNIDPLKRPSPDDLLKLPLFQIEDHHIVKGKRLPIPSFRISHKERRPSTSLSTIKNSIQYERRPSLQDLHIIRYTNINP
ncbi:CAMK family protein kinase [Tritrichomonas foetus]|uniref:CAMK family protein kinase n=1 Tax=Tritrichomonas foetus TaxID=1144522 RepID=A0A1J4K6J2_9EUKA|nr:CAMK family protein kinase [Tritrichomonas foetus]|eukprot:OHT05326.1 CAMK family protein kinase [Tritrichomonas foetus]